MPLARLLVPGSDVERMTTVAMLQAHGIECFGSGDAFRSIYPGAQLGSSNALAIYVQEDQLEQARALLAAPPQWEPGDVPY